MTAPASRDALDRLRSAEPFAALDVQAFEELAPELEEVRVEAGAVLVRQGDVADRVYVLVSGRMSVSRAEGPGGEHVLTHLGSGAVVGEIAVLAGGERSATVRATEPSCLVGISRAVFRRLIELSPGSLGSLSSEIRQRLRRTQLAIHLGDLFGPLEPETLALIEDRVEWVSLRSGQVLFRESDPADGCYVILSGRLRAVVSDGGKQRVINEMGRGESIGEMALLDDAPRSATVYALRDTELARLSAAAFDRILEKRPQALRGVARVAIERLRRRTAGAPSVDSSLLSIAVVAARPDVRVSDFTRRLVAALSALAPTSHLSRARAERVLGRQTVEAVSAQEGGYIRLSEWLAEEEAAHRFAVYEADPSWSNWTDRAVGQADRVLIVADTASGPAPGETESRLEQRWAGGQAPRTSLVLLHEDAGIAPTGTAAWLGRRAVDGHYHVTRDSERDFASLARTLAGRGIGLVLSGGGARGMAHVGVLRALEAAGVPIDRVGGTSIGAVIAGARALGLSPDEILEGCKRHFASIFDPTLPLVSVLKGRKITRELFNVFGVRDIEDLRIPFFCVSTNLTRAVEVVHDRGAMASAVRASLSLPGVLPPVSSGGDLLIDGGLLNNLPVDVMARALEGGPVIAVDVTPEVDLRAIAEFEPQLSGFKVLWQRINPFSQALPVPYIVSLLTRTTQVAGAVADRKRALSSEADLYLRIPVHEWKLLDFGPIEQIATRGFEASIDKIAEWWEKRGERARAA